MRHISKSAETLAQFLETALDLRAITKHSMPNASNVFFYGVSWLSGYFETKSLELTLDKLERNYPDIF